jgi:alkylation response protein AidB-like acyl-CoA dehydrogenase
MEFSLNKEQIAIQRAAGEFAKGEFDPDAAIRYDQDHQFPTDLWQKAGELGFIAVHIPEAYGGEGLGLLENALIAETFCRRDSGIGMALALADFGSEMIRQQGSEDQKKGTLPAIAEAKSLSTVAFLEEGYCLAPLSTTAAKENGAYLVQGGKSHVTLGGLAGTIMVACQVNPGDPKAQVILMVDRESEGVEVAGMGKKVGMRMIPSDRLFFNGVRIAEDQVVGNDQKGYAHLQDFLNEIRIEAGAMGAGIARGGLDKAMDYAKKREQFGRSIVHFDAVRNKLADMYMEAEMARLAAYQAAWAFDHGDRDLRSSLLAKAVGARAAYNVTHDALQIYGGFGYMTEGQIEHFYRDAKVLDLFLEPNRIQRGLLADDITRRRL